MGAQGFRNQTCHIGCHSVCHAAFSQHAHEAACREDDNGYGDGIAAVGGDTFSLVLEAVVHSQNNSRDVYKRQTLGRGGSDTTAVALAAALHADACEIYTDVDGVYTADPRVVPKARKLDEITYDEMLDLATLGAGVLHNRSVEMAKKYGVQLVVRSSLNDHEGTIVKEETSVERMLISGVALDRNTARISVIGLKDEPGIAFKLFNLLAKDNINVDVILQSIGRENSKDISFTVSRDDADNAVKILEDNMNRIGGKSISCRKDVAKVSIVGAGMMSNPGVAAKMFEALYNNNINISMISTSEIRVTVLIDERDAERAVNAVHDAFGLEE